MLDAPVKFDWGTYELCLKDPDGNEIVIVEYLNKQQKRKVAARGGQAG